MSRTSVSSDLRKGGLVDMQSFSIERLMTFLTALDQDVEIVIKNKPRSRPARRISVVAA